MEFGTKVSQSPAVPIVKALTFIILKVCIVFRAVKIFVVMKIVLLLTIIIFTHCCYLLFAHTFKSVCHIDLIIEYSDKESQRTIDISNINNITTNTNKQIKIKEIYRR